MNLMKDAYDTDEDHMDESGAASKSGSADMVSAGTTGETGIGPAPVAAVKMVTGADASQL